MNRSDEPLFDYRIANWLEEDPHTAPNQALDVVLAAFPSIKQRHALRVPWGYTDVSTSFKLAFAAAAFVLAIVGSAYLLGRPPAEPGVGGDPTPTPAASPTASPTAAPLDTSVWVPYTSDRYGFTISRPDDWLATPAERDWNVETDIEAWAHLEATDLFNNAGGSVGVSAWSTTVAPGSTVESWMEAYCTGQNGGPCSGVQDGAVDVQTKDQHPGRLVFGPDTDTMAFILDGQTMYVVAVWRGETDPTVRPYGGARALLEAFVSTMTLPAESPLGSPGPS